MAKQVKGEPRIPRHPKKGGIICGCGKFIARLIPEGVEWSYHDRIFKNVDHGLRKKHKPPR